MSALTGSEVVHLEDLGWSRELNPDIFEDRHHRRAEGFELYILRLEGSTSLAAFHTPPLIARYASRRPDTARSGAPVFRNDA